MADPAAVAAIENAERRGERRRADRATAARRDARTASRTRYRGLGRDAARALAQERFPEMLAQPLGGSFALPPGAQVKEFLNDHWARIETATGAPLVLSSTLPMRAEREGELEPVDLGLRARDGGFRSHNPLVDVDYDALAPGGTRLVGSSIRVAPVGADDVTAEVAGDRLFFANVLGTAADTDQIVVPAASGFQILWQLRSAAAPTALKLRFDLPDGAILRPARDFLNDVNAPLSAEDPDLTGAEVVRDGERLAYVAPPATFDADGERVPTRYEVRGNQLTVAVDHRGRDLAYPLLVDPEIQDTFSGRGLGDSDKWYATQHVPAGSTAFSFARNFQRDGLQVGAYQGAYYIDGSMGGWNWQAPDGAYVRAVNFTGLRHLQNASSLITGIFRPGVWEAGPNYNYAFENNEGASRYEYAGAPTERNIAFAGLYMHYTGVRSVGALASVSGATITAGDNYGPDTTLRSPVPNGAWTNYRWGAIGYDMSDRGLGLKAVSVTRTGDERNASTVVNLSCTGVNLTVPCQLTHNSDGFAGYGYTRQLPYDLEALGEGIHALHVRAQDVAGNVTHSDTDGNDGTGYNQPAWEARYDKTGPQLVLGGSLYENRNGADLGQLDLLGLTVSATDGDPAGPPSARRSGVSSVKLFIDGGSGYAEEASASSSASCVDSCRVDLDTTQEPLGLDDLAERTYNIKVVATDRVGNPTEARWTLVVRRERAYAAELAAWRQDVERRVDEAVPVVPLSRAMPVPPADYVTAATSCETSEAALAACYDRVTEWGNDVNRWLAENLVGVTGQARDLPEAPIFGYSLTDDTQRDLTRRIRDSFNIAKQGVADPLAQLNVVLGFHQPVTKVQLLQLLPADVPQPAVSLSGIFDPGGADIYGTTAAENASVSAAYDQLVAEQTQSAQEFYDELQGTVPEDDEEALEISSQKAQQQALLAHLVAEGPFVQGAAVQLTSAQLQQLLLLPTKPVKFASILPSVTSLSSIGQTLLDAQADAFGQIVTNKATTAYAAREAPEGRAGPTVSHSDARWETCVQRGEYRVALRKALDPNPVYWSPSRHAGHTVLGKADGGDGLHQKVSRLRARYFTRHSLYWMCAAKGAHDRNVEFEAQVFPNNSRRWSTNWESRVGAVRTTRGLPLPVVQDDISSGEGYLTPGDKARYPDFAILSKRPRSIQYRRLLSIDMTTNEGNSDAGTVIFTTQATSSPSRTKEKGYCHHPAGGRSDYEGCMFGRVTACSSYNGQQAVQAIGSRFYAKVAWANHLGTAQTLRGAKSTGGDAIVLSTNEVWFYCDPRPPGTETP